MKITDAIFILDVLAGIIADEQSFGASWEMTPKINTLSTLPLSSKLDTVSIRPESIFSEVRARRESINNWLKEFSRLYPDNWQIKTGVFYDLGDYMDYTLWQTANRVSTYIVREHTSLHLRRGIFTDTRFYSGVSISYYTLGDRNSCDPNSLYTLSVKIDCGQDQFEEYSLRAQEMVNQCEKIIHDYKIDKRDIDSWYNKEGVTLL